MQQTPLSVAKPSRRGPPQSLAVVSRTSAFPHPPIDIRRNAGSIGVVSGTFTSRLTSLRGVSRGIRAPDPLLRGCCFACAADPNAAGGYILGGPYFPYRGPTGSDRAADQRRRARRH